MLLDIFVVSVPTSHFTATQIEFHVRCRTQLSADVTLASHIELKLIRTYMMTGDYNTVHYMKHDNFVMYMLFWHKSLILHYDTPMVATFCEFPEFS